MDCVKRQIIFNNANGVVSRSRLGLLFFYSSDEDFSDFLPFSPALLDASTIIPALGKYTRRVDKLVRAVFAS